MGRSCFLLQKDLIHNFNKVLHKTHSRGSRSKMGVSTLTLYLDDRCINTVQMGTPCTCKRAYEKDCRRRCQAYKRQCRQKWHRPSSTCRVEIAFLGRVKQYHWPAGRTEGLIIRPFTWKQVREVWIISAIDGAQVRTSSARAEVVVGASAWCSNVRCYTRCTFVGGGKTITKAHAALSAL